MTKEREKILFLGKRETINSKMTFYLWEGEKDGRVKTRKRKGYVSSCYLSFSFFIYLSISWERRCHCTDKHNFFLYPQNENLQRYLKNISLLYHLFFLVSLQVSPLLERYILCLFSNVYINMKIIHNKIFSVWLCDLCDISCATQ